VAQAAFPVARATFPEPCAKKAAIVEGPVKKVHDMRERLMRDHNSHVFGFGQG
jgi:hypothetical protein